MPLTISHATAGTLAAYAAVRPEGTAEQELQRLQTRLDGGQLEFEHLVYLSRGTDTVGTATLRPGARVLAPRLTEDIRPDEAAAWLRHLSHWARAHAPEALLILRDVWIPDLGDLPASCGWTLDEAVALYRTDLTSGQRALDPAVTELPRDRWAFAPIFDAWGEVDGGRAADHLSALLDGEDARLFTMTDSGGWTACAALRIMDAGPHGVSAQITMYGVRPDRRGAGLGRRLHAHLLAVASGLAPEHRGATAQDNHAMRRILDQNGAVLAGLQEQYRLA